MYFKLFTFLLLYSIFTGVFLICEAQDENNDNFTCTTNHGLSGYCALKENCPNAHNLISCAIKKNLGYYCCPYENQKIHIKTLPRISECGKHPDFFTIVGGAESKPFFYPWIVALFIVEYITPTFENNYQDKRESFICGGSLISSYHVLTAAHCVVNFYRIKSPKEILVKVGVHDLYKTGKFYTVSKIFVQENYRYYQRYNDIALLKLSQPVLNKIPFIICLTDLDGAKSVLSPGTSLSVAGWGYQRHSYSARISKKLLVTNVDLVSNNVCTRSYSKLQYADSSYGNGIDDSMLCAGKSDGSADSCNGDSGGPLMYTDYRNNVFLIGIVSFGHGCAKADYPGVYTYVPYFIDWIANKMLY